MEAWRCPDSGGEVWHVDTNDIAKATRLIREALIKKRELGKFSPLTVEQTAPHMYREVWR